MPRVRTMLMAFALGSLAWAPAQAATIFTADLVHEPDSPPLTSTGESRPLSFGTATFELDDAMTALTMNATLFNIDVTGSQTEDVNDNLVAAHIHAPASPEETAGVVWGFFGMPDNDIAPDDLIVTPFDTGVGGTFMSKWDALEGNGTTLTDQIPTLFAERAYLNFHTTQFPAGETRGQIQVPAPGALGLVAIGFLGIAGLRRHRNTAA